MRREKQHEKQGPEGGEGCGADALPHPHGAFGQVRTERLGVVIVRVVLGAPLLRIFIPRPLVVVPRKGPSGGQFLAPVPGLGALGTMVFDGFVQIVIGVDRALLTNVVGTKNMASAHAK